MPTPEAKITIEGGVIGAGGQAVVKLGVATAPATPWVNTVPFGEVLPISDIHGSSQVNASRDEERNFWISITQPNRAVKQFSPSDEWGMEHPQLQDAILNEALGGYLGRITAVYGGSLRTAYHHDKEIKNYLNGLRSEIANFGYTAGESISLGYWIKIAINEAVISFNGQEIFGHESRLGTGTDLYILPAEEYQGKFELYLVMRRCEGDLGKFISSNWPIYHDDESVPGPYLESCIEILEELIVIGNQLEKLGIHRDIKPSNLLLYICPNTGKIHLVLADGGAMIPANTPFKIGIGSAGYTTWEMETEAPVPISANIEQLAITAAKMVLGKHPFTTEHRQRETIALSATAARPQNPDDPHEPSWIEGRLERLLGGDQRVQEMINIINSIRIPANSDRPSDYNPLVKMKVVLEKALREMNPEEEP